MNQSADIPNLVQRLRKLERQSRILKIMLSIVFIFMGAIFLMGQTSSNKKVLTAEEFLLIDKNNKPRGRWGIDSYGSVYLMLKNNKANMTMQVFPEGDSALSAKDNNGKIIILLSLANGSSQLQLNGKDGKGGVSIGGSMVQGRDDSPGLLIADMANKKRAMLSLLGDKPALFLNGKDENPRAIIAVTSEGKPRIALMDKEGKEVFEAP